MLIKSKYNEEEMVNLKKVAYIFLYEEHNYITFMFDSVVGGLTNEITWNFPDKKAYLNAVENLSLRSCNIDD